MEHPEVEAGRGDVDKRLAMLVGELARRPRVHATAEDATEDLRSCRGEVREIEAEVQQRVPPPRVHLAEINAGLQVRTGRKAVQEPEGHLGLLERERVPEDAVAVVVEQPAADQQAPCSELFDPPHIAFHDSMPDESVAPAKRLHAASQASRCCWNTCEKRALWRWQDRGTGSNAGGSHAHRSGCLLEIVEPDGAGGARAAGRRR
mmetsp:Transcript_45817/g.146279  ORF Transcript_45817/g.146279 Transcript_45817/m.146279 type:complete len:205 (+) Transcript_45817:1066-1680(+)